MGYACFWSSNIQSLVTRLLYTRIHLYASRMQMEDTYPICQLSFLSLVLMREEPWFAVCLINVQSHVFITSSSNTDSQNNGMLIIMANSRIKGLTLQKIDLRLYCVNLMVLHCSELVQEPLLYYEVHSTFMLYYE